MWNLSILWLFLANATFYVNCLDRMVFIHTFWALAKFPVYSSVLSCWTNTAPSIMSSSVFLHTCRVSWFARDIHFCHGPVSVSVDVTTISLSSYMWYYHLFSQRKLIKMSLVIPFLLPIRASQHPQYKPTNTSNINHAEEQFQMPAPCWSHMSVFLHKLVQNVKPHALQCMVTSGL